MTDAGDEAATSAGRVLERLVEGFFRHMESRARGGNVSFGSRIKERKDSLSSQMEEEEGFDRPRPEGLEGEEAEALTGEQSLQAAGVEYRTLYAASAEDAAFLSEELSKAGIEHGRATDEFGGREPKSGMSSAISAEGFEKGKDGLYRIFVPDREASMSWHVPLSGKDHVIQSSSAGYTRLSEASEDMHGLMDMFTKEAVQDRLALEGACSQTAPEVPKADFRRGAAGNVTMDFKTVKWDPDASIISDNLKNLGIPFEQTGVSENVERFEFNPAHAEAVKGLVDGLSENVKGMNANRVQNYDDLARAAARGSSGKEEILQGTVRDAQTAAAVKRELMASGIDCQSYVERGTGDVHIAMSREDYLANAHKIGHPDLQRQDLPVPAYNPENPLQNFHEEARRSEPQKNMKSYKAEFRREFEFEPRKVATPAADEKMAVESARAQQRSRVNRQHTHTRGRQ